MRAFIVIWAAILLAASSRGQGTGTSSLSMPNLPPAFEFASVLLQGNNLHFAVTAQNQTFTNYIVEVSENFLNWTPVLTNALSQTSFSPPQDPGSPARHFRLRSPNLYGRVIFHNRNFSTPNAGGQVNVPITGVRDPEITRAQLFLVTGSGANLVYVPLKPLQKFRPSPNQEYFLEPVIVTVVGQPPGTTGLQFVLRVWVGEEGAFDSATYKAQSDFFTVSGPLGGTDSEGNIFPTPDMGGPNGFEWRPPL